MNAAEQQQIVEAYMAAYNALDDEGVIVLLKPPPRRLPEAVAHKAAFSWQMDRHTLGRGSYKTSQPPRPSAEAGK